MSLSDHNRALLVTRCGLVREPTEVRPSAQAQAPPPPPPPPPLPKYFSNLSHAASSFSSRLQKQKRTRCLGGSGLL